MSNTLEALQAIGHLGQDITPPAWLKDGEVPASEMVAMTNGLLHLPTRTLQPHTPDFFSLHSLAFDFDPSAPEPERWLTFVHELWGDDEESIATLGEIMGYILGGGTEQQKLFMIVGPGRSGKGTIARVLSGLLGAHNTVGPTLASLTQVFGLAPLIGKPLAVISDARLGHRTDGMIATERLLSISGEDLLSVDRKYREAWNGKLPARFLILTNELPRFTDASGVLASRFILLTLQVSFYDNPDPRLTDTLLAEAPGIFNWALEGRDRLNARGHFVEPASVREAKRHLEDLSAPVIAFVRDCCDIGPGFEMDKGDLFEAWKEWCLDGNRDRPGTKAVFARDLRASFPKVQPTRPRDGASRRQGFRGIQLRLRSSEPMTTPDRTDVVRDGQGSNTNVVPLREGSHEWYEALRHNPPPEDDPDLFNDA